MPLLSGLGQLFSKEELFNVICLDKANNRQRLGAAIKTGIFKKH